VKLKNIIRQIREECYVLYNDYSGRKHIASAACKEQQK